MQSSWKTLRCIGGKQMTYMLEKYGEERRSIRQGRGKMMLDVHDLEKKEHGLTG